MQVIHSGTTYECSTAIKCENDRYIKLYDENGVETAAFHDISDFSEYTISGGSFSNPCSCGMPVALSAYAIGGKTIKQDDWLLSDSGKFYYEIEHNLISGNENTCDVLLKFAPGTELYYDAVQENGKVILWTDAAPLYDIVINSIRVIKA